MKIKRALISVSDKTGIIELAGALQKYGVEILSTGKTAKIFGENNIPVVTVSDYTRSQEILGGRVKTLHPFIFGGILARRDNPEDINTLEKLKIKTIDLVVVNLYPFEKVKNREGSSFEEIIENIDIGGPSLIRAAAKNFRWVGVITEIAQYSQLIKELEENRGELSSEFLYRLAQSAFKNSCKYDYLISEYLSERKKSSGDGIPDELCLNLEKITNLRYGENPHQKAAFFRLSTARSGLSKAKQLQGKELSFNNYLDMNAAWQAVSEFDKPTAAVVKHTNPCGIASASTLKEAYSLAFDGDPISAFGGVVGLNRQVDKETAEELNKTFLEVIIAPGFSSSALEILKEKPNRRIIEMPPESDEKISQKLDLRMVKGGFLIQEEDSFKITPESLKTVTQTKPTQEEISSLLFAWRVVKQVKSNAIVIVQGEKTVGIGAGQMSRVDAVKIAVMKLKEKELKSDLPLVLASDAFFPFRDAIDEAAKIGIKAIIQPGGSKKDEEVIKACNEYGISMVFTGIRHFKHQ